MKTNEAAATASRPWYKKLIEFPLVAMVIATAVVIGTVAVAVTLVKLALPDISPDMRVLIVDLVAAGGLILAAAAATKYQPESADEFGCELLRNGHVRVLA